MFPPNTQAKDLTIEFEPMPLVGIKGAKVRHKIGIAALDMFANDGFEGSSTRKIADRAGVSHSSLLHHFNSKISLWSYVVSGIVRQYQDFMASRIPHDPFEDPEKSLRAMVDALVDFSMHFPQLHKIMTIEGSQYNERMPWLIENQLRPHYEFVTKLISTLQQQGKVRKADPLRLYYAIIGINGMYSVTSHEIKLLSGRDFTSAEEIQGTKDFLVSIIFV